MIARIQRIFKKPSAEVIAVENLEEARRSFLNSKASAEYHAKMAEYYTVVIDRLEKYLARNKA